METPGLIEDSAERPADVLFPAWNHHDLRGRAEPSHDDGTMDASCVDVSGVSSLCPSYINKATVLAPLHQRSQEKLRRVLPDGLFVVPAVVFSSSTGALRVPGELAAAAAAALC